MRFLAERVERRMGGVPERAVCALFDRALASGKRRFDRRGGLAGWTVGLEQLPVDLGTRDIAARGVEIAIASVRVKAA